MTKSRSGRNRATNRLSGQWASWILLLEVSVVLPIITLAPRGRSGALLMGLAVLLVLSALVVLTMALSDRKGEGDG
jgi:hypothetical protein